MRSVAPDPADDAIKVMIVDDTDHVRRMLRNMLELDGFLVVGEAGSGPDAIASELGAIADALGHPPFTAESLAARLEDDPAAVRVAEIAALALALRGLSPADAATVNRILAEGPRTKPEPRKRERR